MTGAKTTRLMVGTAALVSLMYGAGIIVGALATDDTLCAQLPVPQLTQWCEQAQRQLGVEPQPAEPLPLVTHLMPETGQEEEPRRVAIRRPSPDQVRDFEEAVAHRAVDLIFRLITQAHDHPDEPLTNGIKEALSSLFVPVNATPSE